MTHDYYFILPKKDPRQHAQLKTRKIKKKGVFFQKIQYGKIDLAEKDGYHPILSTSTGTSGKRY